MTICILFKNGKEVRMECTLFKHKINSYGNLCGIEYKGSTENAILWLDSTEVACIYRVYSNEQEE